MQRIRSAVTATLLTTAALAVPGAAIAAPQQTPVPAPPKPQFVSVHPNSGAPGTSVVIAENLCGSATATSKALGTLSRIAAVNAVAWKATVQNVAAGTYPVTVTCGNGRTGATSFTVTGTTSPQSAMPVGAAKTGLGGGSGNDPAELAAGAALAAAVVGGGIVLARRRSGARRS